MFCKVPTLDNLHNTHIMWKEQCIATLDRYLGIPFNNYIPSVGLPQLVPRAYHSWVQLNCPAKI